MPWPACLAAIAATAFLLLAAYAAGGLLERREPATRLLAGSGLLGLGLFLAGMIWWSAALVWAVLTPLVLFGARDAWRAWRVRSAPGNTPAWLLLVLSPLGLYLLLLSLVPPMGPEWYDPIAYHLLGPEVWKRTHHIAPVLDHSHTAFPATIEVLHASLMQLANVRATGILSFVWMVLFAAQVWLLVRDWRGSRSAAALATLIAATSPFYLGWATAAYVDIPFAAMVLVGLRRLSRASTRREALLAGCYFGFALGIKYNGIQVLALALLCLVLVYGRRALAPASWALTSALVVGGAWYLRNWIVLGSPIFPPPVILARWLHPPTFPVSAAQRLQTSLWHEWAGHRSWPRLLTLPFRFTFDTIYFNAQALGLAPLAFLPLALLPAAIPRPRPVREFLFLLTWAVLFVLFWFWTDQDGRFLMAAFGVGIALAGCGAAAAWKSRSRALRTAALAVLAVTVGAGYLHTIWSGGENLRRVESLFSPSLAAELWYREVPNAPAFAFLNHARGGGTVLVLEGGAPVYYLHRPYIKTVGAHFELPLGPMTVPEALAHLQSWRITYVLDSMVPGYSTLQLAQPPPGLHLVFQSPTARIYRVGRADSPAAAVQP